MRTVEIPVIDTTDIRTLLSKSCIGEGSPEYALNGLRDIALICDHIEAAKKPKRTLRKDVEDLL